MQAKKVLLALVLGVILYSTYGKKHHYKSNGQHSTADNMKVHKHEEDDLNKRSEHDKNHSSHHHHKRQSETGHHVNLRTGSKHPIKPGRDLNEKPHVVKRQGGEPTEPTEPTEPAEPTEPTQPTQPTEPTQLTEPTDPSATPGTPSGPAPPVPIPDLHVDVGKVNIQSQTDSCNGVLLEPTFVLTSATCVYPNHTAEAFENITFTMGKESKPVKKVFRNPYWHLTGERKEDFALLQLQQPMPHENQKYLTSMTWSSYALEDLGDSYVADPDPTGCDTASNTARLGDGIRHVSDQLITLACSNKGTFDPGSPIFRLVDGAPVIYGVYFGHCTTGSLDRAISGSCGARISKQVFLDFCQHAQEENVDLTSCGSELLAQTHTNFPTTVFSLEGYDAMVQRNHNPKDVVLAYHSSASQYYQGFVEDMETIQRLKTVYDKFQIAVVDVNILAVAVKAVPFIEYRTKSSEAFILYTDPYEFTQFRNFMDVFGKVGAPPSGTVGLLQSLYLHKRSDVPGTTRQPESLFKHLPVKSNGDAGASLVPQETTCHVTGGYYLVPDTTCTCFPTHFGSGIACDVLKTVLQANCEYSVDNQNKNYQTLVTEAADNNWCNVKKSIEATVTASSPVSGKTLTPDHCADAIVDLVACSYDNNLQILRDSSTNSSIKRNLIERRSPINTKTGDPPESYLTNFEGKNPPGPITHAPNTHYFTVDGETADVNPYSVLFDGNRGIPVLVGFKVSNANMKLIDTTKAWLRNKWTKLTQSNVRMGTNKIYLGRSNNTRPEAVEEGQLNPNRMHSYNGPSMDLTFNHINAFPQYSDFANGVWRKYQEKIILYAKDRCSIKDDSAVFHAVSGLSDYELTGSRSYAFLKPATFWPVAYEGAIPQPIHSSPLEDGLTKSIIKPQSVWTVGCCTWTADGEPHAETVSFWANNKPRGIPKHEIQPDLHTLAGRLFPGKPCFQFFPANPHCNIAENHYTLAP